MPAAGMTQTKDRKWTGAQAVAWLREQIDNNHPGWNPVLEMVRLYHKERITRRDRERFSQLVEIAKYVQPKLRNVEIGLEGPSGADGGGHLSIYWRGNGDVQAPSDAGA